MGEVPHKFHELVRGGVVARKFKVTGKHQNVGSRKQVFNTEVLMLSCEETWV